MIKQSAPVINPFEVQVPGVDTIAIAVDSHADDKTLHETNEKALIPLINEETSLSLQLTLLQDPVMAAYISYLGIVWPNIEDSLFMKARLIMWNSAFWLSFLFIVLYAVYTLMSDSVFRLHNLDGQLASWFSVLPYLFQIIMLFPALKYLFNRLSHPSRTIDIQYYTSTKPIWLTYCCICFFLGVWFPILLVLEHVEYSVLLAGFFALLFGNAAVLLINTALFSCTIVDITVSVALVKELSSNYHHNRLTFHQYEAVREEVHRRVQLSFWTISLMICVALLNIAGFVVLMYVQTTIFDFTLTLTLFVKEIAFVGVVFVYSASVNKAVDLLIEDISAATKSHIIIRNTINHSSSNNNSNSSNSIKHDNNNNTNHKGVAVVGDAHQSHNGDINSLNSLADEMNRLSLYIHCSNHLISHTLLTMRLRQRDVWMQVIGTVLSIAIGIIWTLLVPI